MFLTVLKQTLWEPGNDAWSVITYQVGLALSYAAPIVSNLGSFLSSFTETEKEMVSIERVLQVI